MFCHATTVKNNPCRNKAGACGYCRHHNIEKFLIRLELQFNHEEYVDGSEGNLSDASVLQRQEDIVRCGIFDTIDLDSYDREGNIVSIVGTNDAEGLDKTEEVLYENYHEQLTQQPRYTHRTCGYGPNHHSRFFVTFLGVSVWTATLTDQDLQSSIEAAERSRAKLHQSSNLRNKQ